MMWNGDYGLGRIGALAASQINERNMLRTTGVRISEDA